MIGYRKTMEKHIAMYSRKRFLGVVVTTQNTKRKDANRVRIYAYYAWCSRNQKIRTKTDDHHQRRCSKLRSKRILNMVSAGMVWCWPARSPDLSCIDYFLWGYVKTLVRKPPLKVLRSLLHEPWQLLWET
ncbi:hypothetical protein X975_25936, partial [Stegodyphus mimosarum]